MPQVSEALHAFLQARQLPSNADLIARWSVAMETQVNVMAGEGEPVVGKRSTWTNGTETWWNIRIPHDANTEPKWDDYKLTFPFSVRAEGIGCTGWDWKALRSRWFGFDFDALTSHAKGVGISPEDLEKVKQAAMQLPYVEVRHSTGGAGVHLYVYCDEAGIPTANHTEHAALARCILGMMSSECNFDFASQIDCCGGVMWIWHRKMTAENGGLSVIKPATKVLAEADLPSNWRDHIEVVTRKRSKVRINEIADGDDLDTFEKLASARKIIPLDDSHKAQIAALQQTHYTTLWVADHHLLQTHTCALKEVMDNKELDLIGVFETSSEGKDRGSPNCFLFPLPNGGWRVFRFSPGVSEKPTWSQDGKGWTTCYFNHRPDLDSAAKMHGGLKDPDKAGYTFETPKAAAEVARLLGEEKIAIDPAFDGRTTLLRPDKDGHLVIEIERKKGDAELKKPEGWLAKKTKWVRVFETNISKNEDEADQTEYDNLVRVIISPAKVGVGWIWREKKEWIWHSPSVIERNLQSLGHSKEEAILLLGAAGREGWHLVSLPFQPEYPGGRRWNEKAAQFAFPPAELEPDQTPVHPNWDKIFAHIGVELTPALRELPWAAKSGILTGADYLKAWVACAFREPFEQLPYLFLWGNEKSGKSILHEALSKLLTTGVVKADKTLSGRDNFNGELVGAIICAVEEVDISMTPGAAAKIRDFTTAKTLSIRQMRRDAYEIPNTTHWIQTSNKQGACPIPSGDTRIVAIEVGDLLEEQRIPKLTFLKLLADEGPHLLCTLLRMPMPPLIDRLRLPVVGTPSKERTIELNKTDLQRFIDEMCQYEPHPTTPLSFADFYENFVNKFLDAGEKGHWSKIKVTREMPNRHPVIHDREGRRFVQDLILKRPRETAT